MDEITSSNNDIRLSRLGKWRSRNVQRKLEQHSHIRIRRNNIERWPWQRRWQEPREPTVKKNGRNNK